jgi:hypothetical protein
VRGQALKSNISTEAANSAANAIGALLNDGFLRIYSGAKPQSVDAPISKQTLLAELRFNSPAFSPASGGKIVAINIRDEQDAPASGEASWFRTFKADGKTGVIDGTVGRANAHLILPVVMIEKGARIQVSTFTHEAERNS